MFRRRLKAYRQSFSLIDRICSDQYLTLSLTREREKKNQVFVYLTPVFTLAFGIQYQSTSFLIWINEKTAGFDLHQAFIYLLIFFVFAHKICKITESVLKFSVSQKLLESSRPTEEQIY